MLLGVIERRRRAGEEPACIVLTHGHRDHAGGALDLARELETSVRAHADVLQALGPRPGGVELRPLAAGEELELPGLRLCALHTPGHAPGHVALLAPERSWLACGDLLSGLSTILIDPRGGGDMEAYLGSLERVRALGCKMLFPGHGPPLAGAEVERAITHRLWRDARVVEALGRSPSTLAAIARHAYAEMTQMPAALAESQTLAHLAWLERRGLASRMDTAGTSWTRA
jgi:glyoxylase-like metal-dependent hydrolase (beta-lactamase superfamily II)